MTSIYDIFSISDLADTPKKFERFAIREDPPSFDEQSWHYQAHAYASGFERLASEAISLWPLAPYLQIPVFYLFRHSIELNLKMAIHEVERLASSEIPQGHSLAKLWKRLLHGVSQLGYPTDDTWTKHCDRIINHVNEVDPDGERFRYPSTKSGSPFPYTRVELSALVRAHSHITTYCDAVLTELNLE